MDERVLTKEGRAALVAELRAERERGPQSVAPADYDPATAALLAVAKSTRVVPEGHVTPRPERAADGMSLAQFAAHVAAYALTLTEVDPRRWQDSAVCVLDPAATNAETSGAIARARLMCAACPVRRQCQRWADADPHFAGVAGGYLYGDTRAKTRRQEVA